MFKFLTKSVLSALVAGGLFGGIAKADTFVAPPEMPCKKPCVTPMQYEPKKPVQYTTQYEPKKPTQYTMPTQWDSKKPDYTPPSQWDSKKPVPYTPTQQSQQQQYVKPVPPVVVPPAPKKY
jgi:hypothetical protein